MSDRLIVASRAKESVWRLSGCGELEMVGGRGVVESGEGRGAWLCGVLRQASQVWRDSP